MADALSRQPGEASQPDYVNIGDSGDGLYALKDPIVLTTVESWFKVVVLHLVLADYVLGNGYIIVLWPSSGWSGLQEVQQATVGP